MRLQSELKQNTDEPRWTQLGTPSTNPDTPWTQSYQKHFINKLNPDEKAPLQKRKLHENPGQHSSPKTANVIVMVNSKSDMN